MSPRPCSAVSPSSAAPVLAALLVAGLLGLLPGAARAQSPAAAVDPAALVHRALVENKHGLDALRNYIFLSDVTEDEFGKDNRVVKTTVTRQEIFFVDGEPAIRTLLVNGSPLPAGEQAKQEKQLDAQIADAQSSNPRFRDSRQKKADKALAEEYAIREDIADAYLFTVTGEQPCGEHRCVRIAAEPRPGFKGKSKVRTILPYIHGTLLIDTESGQWVDIDVVPIRKIGAGILYLNTDTSIHLHQDPVPGGLWVLTRADARLDSRLLWQRKNIRYRRINHDFRRFGAAVRLVDAAPADLPASPAVPAPSHP